MVPIVSYDWMLYVKITKYFRNVMCTKNLCSNMFNLKNAFEYS